MHTLSLLVLVGLLASGAAIKKRTKESSSDVVVVPWLLEAYPSPESDQEICRSKSMKLCDPNSILKEEEARNIEEFLLISRTAKPPCSKTSEQVETIEVQFAVALARKVSVKCTANIYLLGYLDLFSHNISVVNNRLI
jgi:hypothetical protein